MVIWFLVLVPSVGKMKNQRDPLNIYIGWRVQALRETKGWSEKQLAAHMGCHSSQVRQCEIARLRLTPRRLFLFAHALGVSVSDLFPDELE